MTVARSMVSVVRYRSPRARDSHVGTLNPPALTHTPAPPARKRTIRSAVAIDQTGGGSADLLDARLDGLTVTGFNDLHERNRPGAGARLDLRQPHLGHRRRRRRAGHSDPRSREAAARDQRPAA